MNQGVWVPRGAHTLFFCQFFACTHGYSVPGHGARSTRTRPRAGKVARATLAIAGVLNGFYGPLAGRLALGLGRGRRAYD